MSEIRGLVLAAGYGRRLRPLTDRVPKPLLPYLGTPLLDRAIASLLGAGCARVAVNAHHLAETVAAHVAVHPESARLHLSRESEILGTAGALDGARTFLAAAGTIVVHNGDVVCDLDLARLVAHHVDRGALVTLAVVDRPEFNSVRLDAGGGLRDIAGRLDAPAGTGDRLLTFTGLAVYDRAFLDLVPPGRSELVPALLAARERDPDRVRGVIHEGLWEDLGTVTRYLDAHRAALGPGFTSKASGTTVPPDSDLPDCVVLAGARLEPGTVARRAVFGRGFTVTEEQNLVLGLAPVQDLGFDATATITPISGHGSDRRYWRIAGTGRRAVVMRAPPGDPEFGRTVAILRFLNEEGLGTPAVLGVDARAGAVVQEDLGPETLVRLANDRPGEQPDVYARVLDRLAELQTRVTFRRDRCPECDDRVFDREHLRWESDYFRERFLHGHCGLAADLTLPLEPEFEALATAVLDQPRVLVHRDFQSQNILLTDGEVRLVDVQGMRLGPLAYDVMALLRDAYVDLDPALRERLRDGHRDRLTFRDGPDIEAATWQGWCVAAGLQRVMQALGAFGFLAHVKGKTVFLDHVPVAVRYLRELLAQAENCDPRRPGAPPPLLRLRAVVEAVKT